MRWGLTSGTALPDVQLAFRQNFFATRVISAWNSLPNDCVNSTNVKNFKNGLDQLDLSLFLSRCHDDFDQCNLYVQSLSCIIRVTAHLFPTTMFNMYSVYLYQIYFAYLFLNLTCGAIRSPISAQILCLGVFSFL